MQVKDGSWYQAVNKALYQVRASCGNFWLFGINGDATGVAVLSSGRSHLGIPGAPHDLIREVSDPTKPIQLRVGGRYLRADGSEHEIVGTGASSNFPFRSSNNHVYTASGGYGPYRPHANDLICEILDPATEPELVFVAGQLYETRNGSKRIFIGENLLDKSGWRYVFADECGILSCRYRDGKVSKSRVDSGCDIIRPWIDPPTEFVFNGKRYRVGEEIKEPAK